MGRPRAFDVDTAVDAAMELFWDKGYADTSISDLEAELAVGRQSLYGAFGDKRQLFAKTLDRYLDRQPEHRRPLWDEEVGIREIRAFFAGVVAFITEGGRSCYLVASAVTEVDDPDVIDRCARNQEHLVRSFDNALRGAARRGEIAADTDIAATALLLASHIYGLNVMARNGSTPDTLQRVAQAAIQGLL